MLELDDLIPKFLSTSSKIDANQSFVTNSNIIR